MIHATNIGVISRFKRDLKKDTVDLVSSFAPIGMIEDYSDPTESKSKFSMQAKTRNVSIESARKRIETLRKYKGAIINATQQ